MSIDGSARLVYNRALMNAKMQLSSMDKGLSICEALADSPRGLGVTKLAQSTGLPKSTVHRLLKTLQGHDFVTQSGTEYMLGMRFMELSHRTRWGAWGELQRIALPHLEDLGEQTGQTVHLGVLHRGLWVLYLEKLNGFRIRGVPSGVGSMLPASCTAIGKAMLAFNPAALEERQHAQLPTPTPHSIRNMKVLQRRLERIRTDGIALDVEESKLGLACLGVPILDSSGRLVAGLSVAGTTRDFKPERWSQQAVLTSKAIGKTVSELKLPQLVAGPAQSR